MEGWLATIRPELLDRWEAYERLYGDEDMGYQMQRIIDVLKLGFVSLCHASGLQIDLDDLDPKKPKKEIVVGPAAAAAMMGAC